MKKITLTIVAIATAFISNAQTDVYININHKMGNQTYAHNTNTSNDLGNSFQFTRMEYYISEITLTYDGGQDTTIDGKYLLVRADQMMGQYLLGSFNITNLESIRFGIGVDSAFNHLDPSSYTPDHPLAHQIPSMHWGWAAGYRFVAFEGMTGPNMNLVCEIHALGTPDYGYTQTITTAGKMDNGDLIIGIDADYQKALKGITVDGNLHYHGEGFESSDLLSNFRNEVFTATPANFSIGEEGFSAFNLYPNPSKGTSWLVLEDANQQGVTLDVNDITGRVILKDAPVEGRMELDMEDKGIYILSLKQNNRILQSQKLVIQ